MNDYAYAYAFTAAAICIIANGYFFYHYAEVIDERLSKLEHKIDLLICHYDNRNN